MWLVIRSLHLIYGALDPITFPINICCANFEPRINEKLFYETLTTH